MIAWADEVIVAAPKTEDWMLEISSSSPEDRMGVLHHLHAVQGEIQADGTYALRTGEHAGIRPGAYRVTVRSIGILAFQNRLSSPQPPERYSDPRTSGLACKVQTVEDHTINFHLQ